MTILDGDGVLRVSGVHEGALAEEVRPAAPIGEERELFERVRRGTIPRAVAIIMDGNGRWAKRHGLPRTQGHRRGAEVTKEVVRAAGSLGISYLTLFSFSSENWGRPQDEVDTIMLVFQQTLEEELESLIEENVRMQFIGRVQELPDPVVSTIERAVRLSEDNTGLTLVIAVNYGARRELVDAFKEICERVLAGGLTIADINERLVSNGLYTKGIPDPDLLIRTSGEMRVSNFLLWQIAYTELWVTPTLWPDFGPRELYRALADFQGRTRRFGGV